MIIARFLVFIVLLGAVILFPWWIFMPLLLLAFSVFKRYYEGVFAAFLGDTLYAPPFAFFAPELEEIFIYALFLTAAGAALFVFIEAVRVRLLL